MVFDGIARAMRHAARRRSAVGVGMLALFVFGVWLAPALHRAQCDHVEAASPRAAHDAEPHSCPDTAGHEDPGGDSDSAPVRHHPDTCPLCKLAKTPMAQGLSVPHPAVFVPVAPRPLAEPELPHIGRMTRSHTPRGPPVS